MFFAINIGEEGHHSAEVRPPPLEHFQAAYALHEILQTCPFYFEIACLGSHPKPEQPLPDRLETLLPYFLPASSGTSHVHQEQVDGAKGLYEERRAEPCSASHVVMESHMCAAMDY